MQCIICLIIILILLKINYEKQFIEVALAEANTKIKLYNNIIAKVYRRSYNNIIQKNMYSFRFEDYMLNDIVYIYSSML